MSSSRLAFSLMRLRISGVEPRIQTSKEPFETFRTSEMVSEFAAVDFGLGMIGPPHGPVVLRGRLALARQPIPHSAMHLTIGRSQNQRFSTAFVRIFRTNPDNDSSCSRAILIKAS